MILLITLPEAEGTIDPRLNTFPLELLPRRCPLCGNRTIIGHGQRQKQAHDQVHDVIGIRRGWCRPCHQSFTVLPNWSPPKSHYSLHCRQQAVGRIEQSDVGWEHATPSLKDPNRLPDPSTLRRWTTRRLISWCSWLRAGLWRVLGWRFFRAPTILAWDWPAARRILRFEASSP